MRTSRRSFIIGALSIVATLAAVAVALHAQDATNTAPTSAPIVSQDSSDAGLEAGSAALFSTYCATCHDGPGANPQAPSPEVMKRMSAEQVLNSLESGAMRIRAAERSRAQRRALAEYVSGKPLAADSGGSMPKSAFCSATSATRPDPLAGPAWNGWGHGITNTRFQSARRGRNEGRRPAPTHAEMGVRVPWCDLGRHAARCRRRTRVRRHG